MHAVLKHAPSFQTSRHIYFDTDCVDTKLPLSNNSTLLAAEFMQITQSTSKQKSTKNHHSRPDSFLTALIQDCSRISNICSGWTEDHGRKLVLGLTNILRFICACKTWSNICLLGRWLYFSNDFKCPNQFQMSSFVLYFFILLNTENDNI